MNTATCSALGRWLRGFARTASGLVFLMGVVVLLGWALDIAVLETVLPGWAKMAANTAVAFALARVALALVTAGLPRSAVPLAADKLGLVRRLAVQGCAGIVVLIGLLKLSDYLMGWNIGLDQLWFNEPQNAMGHNPPGRMSPATALNFVLLGGALLLAKRSGFFSVFQILTLLAGLIGWLGFSRYVYGGTPLVTYAQMSIYTALLFLVLSAGVLCARTDGGLMALLVSDSAGGMIARRLLPPALLVPLVLGWLRLQGQRAGWFETEAGVSLFALSNVMVFGALVWANAALLHRTDSERKLAERKLQAQLERLNLLHQITRAIGEHQDLHSIFQVVIRSLEDQLPIDFGCVCLYDPADNALTITSVGLRSEALAMEVAMSAPASIAIDPNGLSRCVHGQLVYEPDITQVPMPFPQRLEQGGMRALVVAPLLVERQVFGVLIAARQQPHSFSSGECEFLQQLSEHVALAAYQAQLYGTLEQAYDDLRQTQQTVMQQERLRALGQMASGITHNINNAISPVALYTESLLEQEPSLSARARRYLETIRRAIEDVA